MNLLAQEQPIFHSDVNLVNLSVRVTDKGRDVAGLQASDFTLLEDGRPQKIAFFAPENQPVTLGILLDTSGSMAGRKIREAKEALTPLITAGNPDNEIWYMEFNNEVGPIVELTGAGRHLPAAVTMPVSQRASTAVYDALSVAMCRLRNARHPRQALVVITDGADQASRIHLEEMLRMVRSSPVQVFMLGYFSGIEHEVFRRAQNAVQLISGRDIDNPIMVFERLARESGAEKFFPHNDGDLQKAVAAVANVLRTQYTLGYYPDSGGIPFRKIEVKVGRRGVQVQTRPYVFLQDAVSLVFTSTSCSISPQQRPFPYEGRLTLRDNRRVYHDDFSDPASGWPQNSEHSTAMEVPFATKRGYSTDGYTLFHVGQHNSMLAEAVLSAYGPWWKNFRATLELTPRSVDQASGMVFRLNDQGFYAFLLYQPSRTPGVFVKVVRRQFDGHSTDIAGWQPAGVLPGPIPAHRQITVEARGDSFKFFVDGRLVIELRDSMMEDGLVGMAAYGLGTSRFHDLLVEELP